MKQNHRFNLSRRRFLQATGIGTAALALPTAALAAVRPKPASPAATEPAEDLRRRYEDDARWAGCCDLPTTSTASVVAPVGYFAMT